MAAFCRDGLFPPGIKVFAAGKKSFAAFSCHGFETGKGRD